MPAGEAVVDADPLQLQRIEPAVIPRQQCAGGAKAAGPEGPEDAFVIIIRPAVGIGKALHGGIEPRGYERLGAGDFGVDVLLVQPGEDRMGEGMAAEGDSVPPHQPDLRPCEHGRHRRRTQLFLDGGDQPLPLRLRPLFEGGGHRPGGAPAGAAPTQGPAAEAAGDQIQFSGAGPGDGAGDAHEPEGLLALDRRGA